MMEIIPPAHMIADSVELTAGSSSDSVSDLQTIYDGNNYHIDEIAGTPGFDLIITFINVLRFSKIAYSAYYAGSATHWVEMQLYNYETGAWETYTTIEDSNGMNYRFFDTTDFEQHVKKGEVKMRFCHVPSGTGAHDFYIDYAALIR